MPKPIQMRQLTKGEQRQFKSYFEGFKKGAREMYVQVPSNERLAWKTLNVLTRAKLVKKDFNEGYRTGHSFFKSYLTRDWNSIDPEPYEAWYKQQWLYKHIYGGT